MPFNRTSLCVAIGLLFSSICFLATPSFGQGPLGFQIFAPADVSTYGGEQAPNEGYFFQFDGLYWSISAPKITPVGYPGTRKVYYGPTGTDMRIQTNTLDTSLFDNEFSAGNRIEFGRIEDNNGWLVSIYQQRDQSQEYSASQVDMVFNDPQYGSSGERLLQGNTNNHAFSFPPYSPAVMQDLPVTFTNVSVVNGIKTWGVELNYLHRFTTCHTGGTFEMFLGARYYEFDDSFNVSTGGGTTGGNVGSFLDGSSWNTAAQNHIIGPQIGLRWFKKQGRWTFSTEGRFFAGMNSQNIKQQVDMGPNLSPGVSDSIFGSYYTPFQPVDMAHTTTTHAEYSAEWSPGLELRLEGRYQITRCLSLHAGWTGMWMDGIARASSMIDYTVPAMGIDMAGNRESIFVNGLTLGFDVNR